MVSFFFLPVIEWPFLLNCALDEGPPIAFFLPSLAEGLKTPYPI